MKHILSFLLLFISCNAFADLIDDGNHQFYGKVIYIDKSKITIQLDCNGGLRQFNWSDNVKVAFSSSCSHPGWELSTSPVTADYNCNYKMVFELLLRGANTTSYAEEFSIRNGNLHIVYCNGAGSDDIPVRDLHTTFDWVVFTPVCQNNIPGSFPVH